MFFIFFIEGDQSKKLNRSNRILYYIKIPYIIYTEWIICFSIYSISYTFYYINDSVLRFILLFSSIKTYIILSLELEQNVSYFSMIDSI